LRFDASDGVWRVAFAFDRSRKTILLLLAGDKSGGSEKRFYRQLLAKADQRFGDHLARAKKEREMGHGCYAEGQNERPERGAPQEDRARAAHLIAEEMTLQELRQARKITQVRMAKELGINQNGVSRLEKRSDLLLSTLRKSRRGHGRYLVACRRVSRSRACCPLRYRN
jgi:DNA-binding XRE family transcriptional regulator